MVQNIKSREKRASGNAPDLNGAKVKRSFWNKKTKILEPPTNHLWRGKVKLTWLLVAQKRRGPHRRKHKSDELKPESTCLGPHGGPQSGPREATIELPAHQSIRPCPNRRDSSRLEAYPFLFSFSFFFFFFVRPTNKPHKFSPPGRFAWTGNCGRKCLPLSEDGRWIETVEGRLIGTWLFSVFLKIDVCRGLSLGWCQQSWRRKKKIKVMEWNRSDVPYCIPDRGIIMIRWLSGCGLRGLVVGCRR